MIRGKQGTLELRGWLCLMSCVTHEREPSFMLDSCGPKSASGHIAVRFVYDAQQSAYRFGYSVCISTAIDGFIVYERNAYAFGYSKVRIRIILSKRI